MPFVTSNGAKIHWAVQGSGTPVLLIMGHLYSSAMWYPLRDELAKTHRVITFDNRGTGDSDTTSGVTVEQMTADALAVLDAAGEAKAHVYGVSMGGGIAGEFGMAHPDRCRSVTLGCTMLKQEQTGRPFAVRLMYRLPRWVIKTLTKKPNPAAYGSAAPADGVERDMAALRADRWTMKGVREQNKAICAYSSTRERAVRQLTMPVLVLHGDEDQLVDVKYGRELGEIIPGAKTIIYPGAGHNYLVATGGWANRDFIDFIDSVDARA